MPKAPASPPPLADLMKVFEIADGAEQIARAQAEVVPVLVSQLKEVRAEATTIYGDSWLEFVTLAPLPAPRDARQTKLRYDYAAATWAAKRLRDSTYQFFTQAGRRRRILDVRAGLFLHAGGLEAGLVVNGRAEMQFVEEVWRGFRNECTALMEAGAPWIWGDVDLPGPPHTTIADHMDRLLQSRPNLLVATSDTVEGGVENPFARAGCDLICLLPILIGIIEAALDRRPSVRIMHQRLCKYLLDDEDQAVGDGGHGHISSALRYKVFERDGFRCVLCGATAGTGAALEVDHIVPRARGGRNVIENLQTLCDRCNRGKSARLGPDLRRKR